MRKTELNSYKSLKEELEQTQRYIYDEIRYRERDGEDTSELREQIEEIEDEIDYYTDLISELED
ncbi:hypothetical protein HMPREF1551_00559 [Capnocytophaga sp. oral taxon 863 str. F0517]|uniref:hypothetical protein n=1 Tax=Capnocytophaga sp. oral taxon 863 TaxID=1227265 RepID=UPI000395E9D9|nr:hypothetical protein [Capnocytophaga sp. oral taxon 863]ERI64320.1 hypothetical protein HMPREF1551_00559 [Capnocytophaga sp. oral taxon 863 str. F0517]